MSRNELTELEIETEGLRVKLKKGGEAVVGQAYYAPPAGTAPGGPTASGAPVAEPKETGREITSPMVGTFYSAASPEASDFVEVGTEVSEETVVCIIEAMKVMNEVKADTRGVITEIVAENGKPVQYGQPLFRLK